ncbi:HD domain-containing protein [Gaoshiqia sediminis]|uniref:HD domain-containing protein n=1 Tax=Gaoshiqia sediminis TaxID=2986998 RepID=A0AA42C6K1_9BACT|nr:HD domain-containing protein [Gaoshiqia sediminis]MCW0482614.1 HD domain-containing protein [Gaoshiqia sediminis]
MKKFYIFVASIFLNRQPNSLKTNKKKIINDPVFGFITIQSELIFDLIEHPYFQRLRRIKQLGLSCIVFPGANHTRFEHAVGAVYLMRSAISVLQLKGVKITRDEAEAVTAAILLHDIGHGPFSHALEHSIVDGISHEEISAMLMEDLNREFNGKLDLAIRIFKNEYPKKFLHQLVASQLDVDRLDYLRRDSFFSGVTEGVIGSDRIIKMLNVRRGELVIEAKGIYSIEKFLISRRLMYWQVYLHKTVLSAEYLLVNVLKRAKELVMRGKRLFATPELEVFLKNRITIDHFLSGQAFQGRSLLSIFASLDDSDLFASIKQWQYEEDPILAYLSGCLINRKLYRIKISKQPFSEASVRTLREKIRLHFGVDETDVDYFLVHDSITNSAYAAGDDQINILFKNGKVSEINEATDINLSSLSQSVRKYFICYPKELDIK